MNSGGDFCHGLCFCHCIPVLFFPAASGLSPVLSLPVRGRSPPAEGAAPGTSVDLFPGIPAPGGSFQPGSAEAGKRHVSVPVPVLLSAPFAAPGVHHPAVLVPAFVCAGAPGHLYDLYPHPVPGSLQTVPARVLAHWPGTALFHHLSAPVPSGDAPWP